MQVKQENNLPKGKNPGWPDIDSALVLAPEV